MDTTHHVGSVISVEQINTATRCTVDIVTDIPSGDPYMQGFINENPGEGQEIHGLGEVSRAWHIIS